MWWDVLIKSSKHFHIQIMALQTKLFTNAMKMTGWISQMIKKHAAQSVCQVWWATPNISTVRSFLRGLWSRRKCPRFVWCTMAAFVLVTTASVIRSLIFSLFNYSFWTVLSYKLDKMATNSKRLRLFSKENVSAYFKVQYYTDSKVAQATESDENS
jgi:hypothetical protein